MPPPSTRAPSAALRTLATTLLVLHLYASVEAGLAATVNLPGVGLRVHTVLLLGFGLVHATLLLGGAECALLFGVSATVSWAMEQVGVETGAIFGAYRYTASLGPRLGHVPILIPLAWFMMIYPSLVVARVVLDGHATGRVLGVRRIAALTTVAAFVMTAWDLTLDPRMVAIGQWVWLEPGGYFGIPLHNYAGWLATTGLVYALYLALATRLPPRPPREGASPARAALPALLAYGGMMAIYVLDVAHPQFQLIAGFAMGMPLLFALARLASAPLPSPRS